MSEWLTYRLSDFLMFTPETYYRLYELLNSALWPLGLVTMAAGMGLLTLSWRGGHRPAIVALLASAWPIVAYVFHYRRYATIMLAGRWFGLLFVAEGIMLGLWAWLGRRKESGESANRMGLVLAGAGLLLWPLLALLMGRSWKGGELFGLAPDPTAVVTLGLLLAVRAPKWLSVFPLLWCLISWATLWSMHSAEAWMLAAAGVAAALAGLTARRPRKAQ